MYTLDTDDDIGIECVHKTMSNVIIYYLKGDENAVGIMDGMLAKQSTMYVSAISETELFRFPQLSEEEVAQIDASAESAGRCELSDNFRRHCVSLPCAFLPA